MVCHKETYEKLLNEQKSKYYKIELLNISYFFCIVESIGFKLNGSDKDEGEEEDEILNESIKGKIK